MAVFSLYNWRDLFETSLNNWLKDVRPDVKQARIWTDFANDEIQLGVTYSLFYGGDLLDLKPHQVQEKFARKVYDILQIKKKTPKQITVDRRRMLWRGECARKEKVRKSDGRQNLSRKRY